jgi:hypothetical protein
MPSVAVPVTGLDQAFTRLGQNEPVVTWSAPSFAAPATPWIPQGQNAHDMALAELATATSEIDWLEDDDLTIFRTDHGLHG